MLIVGFKGASFSMKGAPTCLADDSHSSLLLRPDAQDVYPASLARHRASA